MIKKFFVLLLAATAIVAQAGELSRVKTQTIAAQVYKRDSVMAQTMEIGGAESARSVLHAIRATKLPNTQNAFALYAEHMGRVATPENSVVSDSWWPKDSDRRSVSSHAKAVRVSARPSRQKRTRPPWRAKAQSMRILIVTSAPTQATSSLPARQSED